MTPPSGLDERARSASRTGRVVTAATAPPRATQVQMTAGVVAVDDMGTHLRRVTLRAPELADFGLSGPDEYAGLLLPPAGAPLVLPDPASVDPRAAVAAIDRAVRPALRWYTIRAHRPHEREIDIVRHPSTAPGEADPGPGAAWLERVVVGDEVGVRSSGSVYAGWRPGDEPAPDSTQLLVADETALPALAAIEEWFGTAPGRPSSVMLVEVPTIAAVGAGSIPPCAVVLERGAERPGSAIAAALRERPPPPPAYGWVCGEGGTVAQIRRALRRDLGLDRREITTCGYWTVGKPRP